MASVQHRSGKWQVRIRHKLLDRPAFATFDDEAAARAYGQHLEAMLDRGIIPVEFLEDKRGADPPLSRLIESYQGGAPVAPSDVPTLAILSSEVGAVRLKSVTASWADGWVAAMKDGGRLAPGTIRKRVGSLARVIDWHWRRSLPPGETVPASALRMLPRGYSQYQPGADARHDISRDRRLLPAEESRIRAALAGEKRQDRERALPVDPAFALLFDLILMTGLRLSEAYRLRTDQIDVRRWVISVEGSNGERGKKKPRVVPLVPALRPRLQEWYAGLVGQMVPNLGMYSEGDWRSREPSGYTNIVKAGDALPVVVTVQIAQ